MLHFVVWIAWSMLHWCPTTSTCRMTAHYGPVARAMARAAVERDASWEQRADDASALSGYASLESGYDPDARGKLGEQGPWQLRWSRCEDYRKGGQRALDCQAREALRRLHEQGGACYTGECVDMGGDWPLARNRMWRASWWVSSHPFTPDAEPVAAR